MKISTIIPIYNAEKYISRCLDSILAQDIESQEIICVDDGSTDHSLEILEQYERKYDNIHVLTQRNCYAGVARNNGLEIAKGEYIHFMDADDYVLPGSYTKVYETATAYAADYVKTRSKTFDMQTGILTENNYFSMSAFPDTIYGKVCSLQDYQDVLLKTARAPWTSFIRKSYLLEHNIRFNSLKCVNDRSFYMDVIMHTNRIVICNCYMTCYQINNQKSLMGIRSENFICLIKSYQIIRNLVREMPFDLKKKVLGYEFNGIVAQYGKLNIMQQKEVENIVMDFGKTLLWNEIDESIITSPAAKSLYNLLNIEFPKEYQLKNLFSLSKLYENSHGIILYGAGRVCLALLQYFTTNGYRLDKISCIVVSDTANNPNNIMKVPVCFVKECDWDFTGAIIIATFENVQLPIYHWLSSCTTCNIWGMTDELYEVLQQENS